MNYTPPQIPPATPAIVQNSTQRPAKLFAQVVENPDLDNPENGSSYVFTDDLRCVDTKSEASLNDTGIPTVTVTGAGQAVTNNQGQPSCKINPNQGNFAIDNPKVTGEKFLFSIGSDKCRVIVGGKITAGIAQVNDRGGSQKPTLECNTVKPVQSPSP